jgi:hypothetical protein
MNIVGVSVSSSGIGHFGEEGRMLAQEGSPALA